LLAAAAGEPVVAVVDRLAWSGCYAGWEAGTIVTFGWVSRVKTPVGEIRAMIQPVPGAAYIWRCATVPAYRGQGRYTWLLRYILAALAADNLERAWIACREDNLAGRWAIELAGFRPVLRVSHVPDARHPWSVEPIAQAAPDDVGAMRASVSWNRPVS